MHLCNSLHNYYNCASSPYNPSADEKIKVYVMPIISNLIISRYTLTFYNFRSICGLLLYIFVNKVTIRSDLMLKLGVGSTVYSQVISRGTTHMAASDSRSLMAEITTMCR